MATARFDVAARLYAEEHEAGFAFRAARLHAIRGLRVAHEPGAVPISPRHSNWSVPIQKSDDLCLDTLLTPQCQCMSVALDTTGRRYSGRSTLSRNGVRMRQTSRFTAGNTSARMVRLPVRGNFSTGHPVHRGWW